MAKAYVLFDGIAWRDPDSGQMLEAFRGDTVDLPASELERLLGLGAVGKDDPGYLPTPLERSRSVADQELPPEPDSEPEPEAEAKPAKPASSRKKAT